MDPVEGKQIHGGGGVPCLMAQRVIQGTPRRVISCYPLDAESMAHRMFVGCIQNCRIYPLDHNFAMASRIIVGHFGNPFNVPGHIT